MTTIQPSSQTPDISFQVKLRERLASISSWKNHSGYDQEEIVESFMDEMGALYLDYFQYHLEEAQAIGLQYATDICWAAKAINMCYIYKLWSRALHADDWSDIWLEVCWGRTNIEAFHAMFGEFVRELDVAGILEYMESKKGHEKVDLRQIPKNVPKSHWWWFEDFTKDNT